MALPILNYDEELPASLLLTPVVQRKDTEDEEDAELFIDKAYERMKSMQEGDRDTTNSPIKEDLKVFIETLLRDKQIHTSSEKYYEQELLNSYKERISYLENENKRLVEILSNLTTNTHILQNCNKIKNNPTTVAKVNVCENALSSTNVSVNDGIQDLPLTQEKHNGEDPNRNNVIKKQLTEVRKSKHEQYLKSIK